MRPSNIMILGLIFFTVFVCIYYGCQLNIEYGHCLVSLEKNNFRYQVIPVRKAFYSEERHCTVPNPLSETQIA